MPKKPVIVAVDDRQDSVLVQKMLLEQFGCEVLTACDAPTCLAMLSARPVDLAIIDYHLESGMNGEQLARTIHAQHPMIATILLTGDPMVPDSARHSVDTVLIKGASSPADLLDAVEYLVPEATLRPRRRMVVPHGDVSLAS